MKRVLVFLFFIFSIPFFVKGHFRGDQWLNKVQEGVQKVWVVPSNFDRTRIPSNQTSVVVTEALRAPEESTGDIVKTLREVRGPVTLICLKKAAADCLESLLLYPKLQKKISRFISINGFVYGMKPIQKIGSSFEPISYEEARKLPPVAALKYAYQSFLLWWYPELPFLRAFRPKTRKASLMSRKYEIQKLSRNVQVLWWDDSKEKYGVLPFGKPL